MEEKLLTTETCKYCNGAYINSGACPKFGLKFKFSPCPPGKTTVTYKEVKVRNDVPLWKFWKSHYIIEKVVVDNSTLKHSRSDFFFNPISDPDQYGYIWYKCDRHTDCNKVVMIHPIKGLHPNHYKL